jgi:hypothetical protein
MQLFHHTNTGRFLLLPLESRKCNTSRRSIISYASPIALEPETSKKFNQWETRNANSNSVKQILTGQRGLEKCMPKFAGRASVNTNRLQRKRGLVSVGCG